MPFGARARQRAWNADLISADAARYTGVPSIAMRHQHQASETVGAHAGMFWLSIRRRMVKRDPKRPSQPSMAAVPAAKAGEDKAEISGITQAQQNGHATNSTNGFKQESLKSR